MKIKSSILLFLVVFSVYLFTLHPTVSPYRDSGDLIVAASTLGLAHPPGYPLYVLCGKVFDLLIPFGNTGYKINLMSALFGALAAIFLSMLLANIVGVSSWVLMAALLLFFSPAYWRLSQVSEMYSLNAFLLSLILLFMLKLYLDLNKNIVNNKLLFLTAFASGLACGNHQTIVFILPGFVWLLWDGKRFKGNDYIYACLFFCFGLSVYLFLPFRAFADPVSSWGEPQSIGGFFRMITRSDYGGMKLHPEQSRFEWTMLILAKHISLYIKSLAQQFTWLGVIFGVIGIYLKRKDSFFRFLFISLLISGPGFVILSNLHPSEETTLPILEPHFVLPNVLFMFFVAASFYAAAAKALGKLLIVFIVLLSFTSNLSECNYRNHFFAYDYARNLFSTLEQNSFIYNPDDSTAFLATYLQKVSKKREDVKLIAYYRTHWGYMRIKKNYPEILPAREILSGKELETVILDHNRLNYSIFSELPGKFPPAYVSYPYGFLYKLSQNNEFEPANDPFTFYVTRGKYDKSKENDFFTNHIISYYASSHNNLGLAYANKKLYDLARQEYTKALNTDRNLIAAYNNLGTLEYEMADYEKAIYWFERVLKYNANSDMVLLNMGLTYKVMGKMAQAQECFLKSWQKNGSSNTGNELGLLYMASGNFSKSIEIFSKIVKRDPNYLNAYYNLGLVLEKAGRYNESKMCYQHYMNKITDPKEKKEVADIIKKLPVPVQKINNIAARGRK